MSGETSRIARARLASALTINDAATITGLSPEAYERREDEHPLDFTLGEIRALASEFNSDGKELLRSWLLTYFGL